MEVAEGKQKVANRPAATCPECLRKYDDARDLAFHLERHREVKGAVFSKSGKKLISQECPRRCGRHLTSSREYREHVPLCKGETPITKDEAKEARERNRAEESGVPWTPTPIRIGSALPVKKETERTTTMEKCPECGKKCANGTGLSAHRRGAHGVKGKGKKPAEGSSPRPRRTPAPRTPAPRTGGGTSDAAQALLDKAKHLREQSAELLEKADKLDKLAEEVAALL